MESIRFETEITNQKYLMQLHSKSKSYKNVTLDQISKSTRSEDNTCRVEANDFHSLPAPVLSEASFLNLQEY